ncbi:MAG: hypothetical protein KDM64_18650, partial [Verrucomicrobiae bacterium]|nr:hypothetical protein [Verrucomicrobiae bacterium]
LEDAWWNLWLRFAGPDLSVLPGLDLVEVDRVASWTAGNRIVYFGPETVKVSFDAKTGMLGGNYVDKAKGVNVTFGGVLLQEQGLVTGRYATPAWFGKASGLFSAEPREAD